MTEQPTSPTRASTEWSIHLIGGLRRAGSWVARRRLVFVSLLGGVELDLTDADLDAGELTIVKVSLVGGVRLRVPPGVRVETFCLGIGGTHGAGTASAAANAAVVRVRSFGVLGGIHVA